MAGNRSIANVTFHNNETAIADGITYNITSDASTLNVDFVITEGTTFTAIFEAKVDVNSTWDQISAFNLRTLDFSTKATTDDTYQLDVTGFSYVRVRLSAVATGSVTVYGKAVG